MPKTLEFDVELVLAELRAVTADLARSADTAILRLILRAELSASINEAKKAEHAAQALRAAASTELSVNQQTGHVPRIEWNPVHDAILS